MFGGLSTRQLTVAGASLLAFGIFIITRGAVGKGILLACIGAAMLGRRFFSSD